MKRLISVNRQHPLSYLVASLVLLFSLSLTGCDVVGGAPARYCDQAVFKHQVCYGSVCQQQPIKAAARD